MLAKTNDAVLTKYKHIDEKYIFFYQRWKEMLDSRTLEMYQYNILNSCTACVELADVIDKTMDGLFNSRQNLEDCKNEALELVKADQILKRRNRPLCNMLLRILGGKIDTKQRGETTDDRSGAFYVSLNRLKYQLKSPVRQLEKEYLYYVIYDLEEAIGAGDRERIEMSADTLVSQCIAMGWSAKGLSELAACFEGGKGPGEKWNAFVRKLTVEAKKGFAVYYSIRLETKADMSADKLRKTLASLGLELRKGEEILAGETGKRELCSKIKAETIYIVTRITAPDWYAAALLAINLLNQKLSVATFYNMISPWIANVPQMVVLNETSCKAVALKMTDVFKTYDYIDSNNGVFEDTNHILTNASKASIMNKLNAVFAYTNLSRTSLFQETKYISLWIALESIMNTGQYPDIITHVKMVLPEIMCVRYIYRIVRNFSEDCIRCGYKTDETLALDMDAENKRDLVRRLISVFRDSDSYAVLEKQCQVHSLLSHRCGELYELLNDAKQIQEKFDHYIQKVRWHIQRLYRLRNEITHSAFRENRSLIIYIEQIYTYLAQLISEMVYYIEHKDVESIEEACAVILENYRTYYDFLKEGRLQLNDILPDGIIDIAEIVM